MKTKSNYIEKLFFVLSIFSAVLRLYNITYINYALFAILFFSAITRKLTVDKFIYYSLFVPDKYLQILSVVIYLYLRKQLIPKKVNKRVTQFIMFITSSAIINLLIHSGNVIQIAFQIVLYYCFIQFAHLGSKEHNTDVLFNTLTKLYWLQIIICTIQLLYYHSGIDNIKGTFINAHYLGIFLVVYSFLVLNRKEKRKYYMCILALIWIIIADAKHVAVVFAFALLVDCFLRKIKIENHELLFSMAVMFIGIVGIMYITNNPPAFLSDNNLFRIYVLNQEYNKKIVFLNRTLVNMLSLNGLFGFGVGLYGSQIAITMGKGVIYPWDKSLSNYRYISNPYKQAMEGLMTQGYTLYGIGTSSMALGYPLVSYIAMIAELGIVGYFGFVNIIDKEFNNCNKTLLIYFFIICLFDTYFEIPSVFVLLLIGTELTRKRK